MSESSDLIALGTKQVAAWSLSLARVITRLSHETPAGKRIAERIRRQFVRHGIEFLIPDYDGDLQFTSRLDSYIGSHIAWLGSYSTGQLRLLDRVLEPEMVFVDVGANEGEHSIFAAKRLTRGAVIALEPSPGNFAWLTRNIELNHFTNVIALNKGLGDSTRTASLFGPTDRYCDGSFNNGLFTEFPAPDIDRPIGNFELLKLDDLAPALGLDRVDVIKLDIEGGELAALEGSTSTLSRFRPYLMIEACDQKTRAAGHTIGDLLSFLKKRKYRFAAITDRGGLIPFTSLRTIPGRDIFCLPQQRPPRHRLPGTLQKAPLRAGSSAR